VASTTLHRFINSSTRRATRGAYISTHNHFHTHASPDSYQYSRAYLDAVSNLYADGDPCSY
jgi:hypothetical protein